MNNQQQSFTGSDAPTCSACVICGCEPAFSQPADKPYVCYSCGITGERSCDGCRLNDYCPMPHQKPKAFGCPLYLPNAERIHPPSQKPESKEGRSGGLDDAPC